MNKARRAALAELRKIYQAVPDPHCKGLCSESCGPIDMTELEHEEMARERGGALPDMPLGIIGNVAQCPLLSPENRCTVYERRPLICRLWGAVDHPLMRCPHGCRPPNGLLTDMQSRRLLDKAAEVSRRLLGGLFDGPEGGARY